MGWECGQDFCGRGFAVTAINGAGVESAFSDISWSLYLSEPDRIAIDNDNNRIVGDLNSVALQSAEAESKELLFGWHGMNDGFMTVVSPNRLVFSVPGDGGVAIRDIESKGFQGEPPYSRILGGPGADPGQFQGPAGVAIWGGECT